MVPSNIVVVTGMLVLDLGLGLIGQQGLGLVSLGFGEC